MQEYHEKFLYVLQTEFPPNGSIDGNIADAHMRQHLGQTTFESNRLIGVKPDDLWISTDNDELIR